ncbi:J domain-containing protein [Candidatus Sumerlaeota bacterium]|nr:J domain-containing protein [Candidatus Sumerlaeota bacterium]
MVKFRDYYKILGLSSRDVAADEIRSSYRKLARRYHPDLNKDNPSAEARFREVQEAYDVLSDPVKRKQYDSLDSRYQAGMDFQVPSGWAGTTDGRPQAGGLGGGFSEFFDILFGGAPRVRPGAARPRAARSADKANSNGQDIETALPVTIEEVFTGTSKKVRFTVNSTCLACQGSGMIAGSPCAACEGRGATPQTKTLEIRIPQGVKDGTRLRLTGQGEVPPPGSSGRPGDMLVRIEIQSHPIFELKGSNLYVDLPVAPWEAVLGGEVDVPTLDGLVKMKLPPGTQSGVKMRLRQRGMKGEGARGDEIVTIKVVVPTEITDRERHLFRQLRDISRFRPRVKPRSTE